MNDDIIKKTKTQNKSIGEFIHPIYAHAILIQHFSFQSSSFLANRVDGVTGRAHLSANLQAGCVCGSAGWIFVAAHRSSSESLPIV